MTPKQTLFVEEYLRSLNATDAAIRAGYSPRTAVKIGSENLRKPDIARAIAEAMERRAEAVRVEAGQVLHELARIAFSNVQRLIDDTGRLRSVADLDADTAAAVQSIEVVTRRGPAGEEERVTRIRFWDKLSALDRLARHLGMYPDRVKVQGDADNPIAVLIRQLQGTALPVRHPPESDAPMVLDLR